MENIISSIATNGISYAYKYDYPVDTSNFYSHMHTAYELLLFVEGDAVYHIESNKYTLKPNDLIIIKPAQYHFIELRSTAKYSRHVIHINPTNNFGIQNLLDRAFQNNQYISLDTNSELLNIFGKLNTYANLDREIAQIMLTSLVNEILVQITLNSPNKLDNENTVIDSLCAEAINYIQNNISKPLTLESVAQSLFVSKFYLSHTFKQNLNITFMEYLRRKQIFHAQLLLSSGQSPTQIYSICGFKDYVTFYRAFKKITGSPPSKKK